METASTAVPVTGRPRNTGRAFFVDPVPGDTLINGYFVPLLVVVIVVCNLLVCVVLVRPVMRTATNAVLVAIALSDSLTGLWPIPVYIWLYAAGTKDDWVQYSWCYAYFCLTDYLPTIFHTISIWLTVLLAAQRYACVCRGELPRSGAAHRRSVVVKIIVAIYLVALVSQSTRFIEFDFTSVNVTSRVDSTAYVTGCRYKLKSFVKSHEQVYFNVVYWFRVVFVHLIPCSVLVVLTVLLVLTLQRAQQRKRRLLESRSSHRRQTATDDDHEDADRPASRRRRQSRNSAEGSSTTLMLVTVVVVFLAVELPQAVTLILIIVQHTLSLQIFTPDTGAIASLVCNVIILLSYPTNFFIYCAMSRAFRTTFVELFCPRRGLLDDRVQTTNVQVPRTTGNLYMTNTCRPAATRHVHENAVDDGNVTVALVVQCQEDNDCELKENLADTRV